MSDRDQFYPLDRRVWLLAIGRRLRVEYDAIAEPMPPHLAALVKQLEMPVQGTAKKPVSPLWLADHPAENLFRQPGPLHNTRPHYNICSITTIDIA